MKQNQRYSGCFIINSENKYLLQFRGPFWRTFPNTWCTFGGKIEEGETLTQGLKRELKEELNIIVDENKFHKKYSISFEEKEYNRSGTLNYFSYNITSKEIEKIKLFEGNGFGWFTFEEVMKLETTPNLKEALKESFN